MKLHPTFRTFSCSTSILLLLAVVPFAGCGAAFNLSSPSSLVQATAASPLTITQGGTYSGHWASTVRTVAAVTIKTTEPVILQNSTVSGPGDLIDAYGSTAAPLNVTIENVTGTGVDSGIAGDSRGKFLNASNVASLTVTHCSMTGVSFGVYVAKSTPLVLVVDNNAAYNMEDRASDGNGGFETARPSLGHFIQLNTVSAPNGAEIAWNQVLDTPGEASVEDIINIYASKGASASLPIHIHDNYLQGAFSPGVTSYTGSGIMSDGPSAALASTTGFLLIENNQVVHTANVGIGLEAGHDVTYSNNRVVSCGKDSSGNWIAATYGQGVVLWNYESSSYFYNNRVSGTSGGLVRPNASQVAMTADQWTPSLSTTLNNVAGTNSFTDPCMAGGDTSLAPETAELATWQQKLLNADETVGPTQ